MTKSKIILNYYIKSMPFWGTFLLALFLALSTQVYAGNLVSGRYIISGHLTIVMELRIKSPAPNTVIVIQHLPKGLAIRQAHPHFDKYNQKTNDAKWLLRKPSSGITKISIETTGPIRPAELKGEICYRDPLTGVMSRVRVIP